MTSTKTTCPRSWTWTARVNCLEGEAERRGETSSLLAEAIKQVDAAATEIKEGVPA